jgi:hypothetical protein
VANVGLTRKEAQCCLSVHHLGEATPVTVESNILIVFVMPVKEGHHCHFYHFLLLDLRKESAYFILISHVAFFV